MLDLSRMLSAPRQAKFRVVLERKRGLNANQNARSVAEEVMAANELEAKQKASALRPEFFPVKAHQL